jgi:V/A-type H+/Na+-transporting ATPase subunit G/H
MSSIAESKVTGIIKSLNSLENDLDSLNNKSGDIKKQLAIRAITEIDSLLEKTREMATKEAEVIITASKDKATAESAKIVQDGEASLSEIQSKIDTNFDDAVKYVVSTILKA